VEIDRGDGSTETVLIVTPERIDGRRATESMLRPLVEGSMRSQSVLSQPAQEAIASLPAQTPDVQSAPARMRAGEDVSVFRVSESPEYDPVTQRVITFRGGDKQDYVAIAPKAMTRQDAMALGQAKVQLSNIQHPTSDVSPPLLRTDTQVSPEADIPKGIELPASYAEQRPSGQRPDPSTGQIEGRRLSESIDKNLMSAYRKLGSDDPVELSQMLRDADKRFKKSATIDEIEASELAWAKVQRLTDAEHQALASVVSERTFAPVRADYKGERSYSRAVQDVSLSEPNAQLDRNLADVMNFFDEMAAAETSDNPIPRFVAEAGARLKDYSTGKRSGSGGQQFADLAIVGGYRIYRSGMKFTEWSREMVTRFGESIRPHLQVAWNRLKAGAVGFYRDQEGSALASPGPSKNAGKAVSGSTKQPRKLSNDDESVSLGRTIGKGLRMASQGMRTLWTTMDFSAPLSQGAILSLAHPIKASQSFGKMFKSLRQSEADEIDTAIAFHPLRKQAEDAGLFLATSGRLRGDEGHVEEAFALRKLNELPGIRQAERAYRTYLDTLRLSTWETYSKGLQADGRTPQTDPKAYRQVAEFINIATGRGALKKGGKLEKAMDLAGLPIPGARPAEICHARAWSANACAQRCHGCLWDDARNGCVVEAGWRSSQF
jgi:hypothetical protein